MPDHEEIREWLLRTVQLIVDHPEEVRIDAATIEERTTFRIKAHPSDTGKVIGRQGRTSQSLRVLAGAMGKKFQWRFIVEIEEGNKSEE